MVKKLFSLVIALAMVFSVCSMAFPVSAIHYEDETVYGDLDGDGAVNLTDAKSALRIAAGLSSAEDESALTRSDVNFDGRVTLFDARQILRASADIIHLNPSGAFNGFKGYTDNVINVNSPEAAIAVFNTVLNKVKTEHPGFTRSEAKNISDFNIREINFVGINFGNTVESVGQMIKEMIISESQPEEAQVIFKGTNTYNAMSVEGENYVSSISANGAYGVEVTYDGTELMTIKVALPDSEIDNLGQTAYADLFNTELIQEDAESVIENVFSSDGAEGNKRKEVVNGVATLVFNTATGNVESYTTTYETEIFLASAQFGISDILKADIRGLQYSTNVTVTYTNFQW